MQNTWTYPAVFEREGDDIIVHFPNVPEALTAAAIIISRRVFPSQSLHSS